VQHKLGFFPSIGKLDRIITLIAAGACVVVSRIEHGQTNECQPIGTVRSLLFWSGTITAWPEVPRAQAGLARYTGRV
jgi:hypothetical protein